MALSTALSLWSLAPLPVQARAEDQSPTPAGSAVLASPAGQTPSLERAQGDTRFATCRPDLHSTGQQALGSAWSAYNKGKLAESKRLLVALLAQAPNHLEALTLLAQIEARQGNLGSALEATRRAVAADPTCPPPLLLQGQLLERSQHLEDAVRLWQEALTRLPDNLSIRSELIRVLLSQGRAAEAVPHLQHRVDANPDDPLAHAILADALMTSKRPGEALPHYQQALQLERTAGASSEAGARPPSASPGSKKTQVMNLERQRQLAEALRATGQLEPARLLLQALLPMAPRDPWLKLSAAGVSLDLHRPEEAAGFAEQAVALEPQSAFAWATLARAYGQGDRRADAAVPYQRALKLEPQDDALRLEAAQVIAGVPSLRTTAEALLKPLVDRQPPNPAHLVVLAEMLSWTPARRTDALNLYGRVLAQDPQHPAALRGRKQTVLWMEPLPSLIPVLEVLRTAEPDDLDLLKHLASACSHAPDQQGRAIALFRELVEKSPRSAEARAALAELLITNGAASTADVVRLLEDASNLGADAPALLLRVGTAFLSVHEAARALPLFERCLVLEPSAPPLSRPTGSVGEGSPASTGPAAAPAAPERDPCLRGMVTALSLQGRYDEALKRLDEVAAQTAGAQPEALRATRQELSRLARRGRVDALLREEKPSEALALLNELLAEDPSDADLWVTRATLQASQKDTSAALSGFLQALSLKPRHVGALEGLIGTLLSQGRTQEALARLDQLKQVAPAAPLVAQEATLRRQARFSTARAEAAQGRRTRALELLLPLYQQEPEDLELALLVGGLLQAEKRHAEALDAWTRALLLSPDHLQALKGQADALWQLGKKPEALTVLQRVRALAPASERPELDPWVSGWEVAYAETLRAQGDLKGALDHYRIAYQTEPERPYVLRGMAGLYWSNQQLDLASRFYSLAAARDPNDVEALRGAAETLYYRGELKAVLKLLENHPKRSVPALARLLGKARIELELVKIERAWERNEKDSADALVRELSAKNPTEVEPLMRLARLQAQAGDHLAALKSYKQVLTRQPDFAPALLATIASLQAMGKYPESGELIRQMRTRDAALKRVTPELNPLEAASWAARADFLVRRAQPEQALEAYRRALELGLDTGWLLASIGQLYANNHQSETALLFFDLALERDPASQTAARGRARLLLSLGRFNEAEAVIESLSASTTVLPEDQAMHAELRKLQGNTDEALELFRILHEQQPDNLDFTQGLIGAALAAGQPQQALTLLNTVLPSQPLDRSLLMATAAALRGLYASDLAVPIYKKLKKYWPGADFDQAYDAAVLGAILEAGEAAKERGELKKARALYEDALRKSPGNVDVLRGLGGLEARSGKTHVALKRFREALKLSPDDPTAVSGYATTLAALGQRFSALAELRSGWERTQSPRVGLEWVRMLAGLERYSEADRQLIAVEQVLGIPSDATEEEVDALLQTPIPVEEALAAIEAFEQIWPRVARKAPRKVEKRSSRPLPVLTWRRPPAPLAVLERPAQARAGETSTASAAPSSPLEDLAPDLPIPSDSSSLPAVRPVSAQPDDRIDLWLVDKLLREMHTLPIQSQDDTIGSETTVAQDSAAEQDGSVTRPPVNPWAGGQEATVAGRAQTEEPVDPDDYAPYRPSPGRARGFARFFPPVFDPVKEAIELRRVLKSHLSPRLYLGGFFNGRTGTAGTTELFSGFADLRMGFQLPGFKAVTFEPFVQPGMVTNGDDFQSGTMAGLGLQARQGRVALEARLGTSPLGFRGGISVAGQTTLQLELADFLRISAEGALEPIADSLTSWAGAETEAGGVYGFVSRARAGATVTLLLDGSTTLSLGGDMAEYSGLATKRNLWRQGRVGFYHTLKGEEGEVELRVRTTAFGFTYQQDGFEVGSGGYFSPLLFLVATGGGYWRAHAPDARLEWQLGLDAGMQYVEGEETESLTPGIRPVLSAGALLSYALSPGLTLGARYEFDNAGAEYTRNTVWIYLSRVFLAQRDRRSDEP